MLLASLTALALAPKWQDPVLDTSDLAKIVNLPELSGGLSSACVMRPDGTVIFEFNAGQRVIPASNQKLLSCAFALHALGPNYRPTVKFWKSGNRIDIESTGAPLTTYAELVAAKEKVRPIAGSKVFVHQSYNPGFPDSWEYDDLPNKYAAPVSALTVDRGSFEVWNMNGRLQFRPNSYGHRIAVLPGTEFSTQFEPITKTLYRTGLPPKVTARLDTLSLVRPWAAAASLFGTPAATSQPAPNRPPLYVLTGPTLAETIKECLPPSDNNIAEHLLLLSAAKAEGFAAKPYPTARKGLTEFLVNHVGIDKSDLNVMDGSGMSRHNLVTTRALCQLLNWQAKQSNGPIYRDALAKPGSGTLRGRLDGVPFAGKTGTLNMVSALSGYLQTQDGQPLVISIALNHYLLPASHARSIQDRFVEACRKLALPR
jgi:D-alanyl-D-alanine carboxypeptidase/D-alanyl-D-alanine-endopeptidase (penicillin-binding protein 4)